MAADQGSQGEKPKSHQHDLRTTEGRDFVVGQTSGKVSLTDVADYVGKCNELGLPDFWFRAGNLSTLGIPESTKTFELRLASAIRYIERLYRYRALPGFEHFVEGWRNGPQVRSAMSELNCLANLEACKHHVSFEFGPYVNGGTTGKRSDLLWKTTHGEFLVESKATRILETDLAESVNRMTIAAGDMVEKEAPTWATLRLDVYSTQTGHDFPALFAAALAPLRSQLAAGTDGGSATAGFVAVTIRKRDQEPASQRPFVRQALVLVGSKKAVLLDDTGEGTYLTVTVPLGTRLWHTLRPLLAGARMQLRAATRRCIIYVETDNVDLTTEYVARIQSGAAFAKIPLVIVSDGAKMKLVGTQVSEPLTSDLDGILPVLAPFPSAT